MGRGVCCKRIADGADITASSPAQTSNRSGSPPRSWASGLLARLPTRERIWRCVYDETAAACHPRSMPQPTFLLPEPQIHQAEWDKARTQVYKSTVNTLRKLDRQRLFASKFFAPLRGLGGLLTWACDVAIRAPEPGRAPAVLGCHPQTHDVANDHGLV